jgi:hypothetical protein
MNPVVKMYPGERMYLEVVSRSEDIYWMDVSWSGILE